MANFGELIEIFWMDCLVFQLNFFFYFKDTRHTITLIPTKYFMVDFGPSFTSFCVEILNTIDFFSQHNKCNV